MEQFAAAAGVLIALGVGVQGGGLLGVLSSSWPTLLPLITVPPAVRAELWMAFQLTLLFAFAWCQLSDPVQP